MRNLYIYEGNRVMNMQVMENLEQWRNKENGVIIERQDEEENAWIFSRTTGPIILTRK